MPSGRVARWGWGPLFVVVFACSTTPGPASNTADASALDDAGDAFASDAGFDATTGDGAADAGDTCQGDGGARTALAGELTNGVWYIEDASSGSWFRMNMTAADPRGSVDYRPQTTPGYFPCDAGMGLGTIDGTTGTAILQLPDGCANEGRTYRFTCVKPFAGARAADLEAAAIEERGTGASKRVRMYRYKKSHCTADFATCNAP